MYQQTTKKLGKYTISRFQNEAQTNYFEIAAKRGAVLTELVLDGVDIYDGLKTEEEIDRVDWSKGALLAPFPNRLNRGRYSFNGREYQFPLNDPGLPNALHGFLYQLPFAIKETNLEENQATVTCVCHYEGQFSYYPFPFKAEVTYTLNKSNFFLQFIVENTGKTAIPMGIGWHPYFKISKRVGDSALTLPAMKKIEVENLIPNGIKTRFDEFSTRRKINDYVLDNCFELEKKSGDVTVILDSDKGALTYRQTVGENGSPFIQIFMPPMRTNIALEPMTCNIDALNNKDGLRILQAKETMELRCSLGFDAQLKQA